jgi:hypothetical protein
MAVALFGVSSLQAAVILPGVGTLDIDFRDTGVWGGANGVNSFSVGGITATASPNQAELTQGMSFGLGVDSQGQGSPDIPSEIDKNERLELVFSGGSGLGLAGVWLTNLFPDDPLVAGNKSDTALVKLTFLDSTFIEYEVPGTEPNGNFFLDFGGNRDVSKIDFNNKGGNSDYSVVGFSVPEGGSTLLVLGMALVGLAGVTSYQRRLAM